MWACGVYDLGLSSETLFSLTPRHFDALLQRFLDQQEREAQRFGLLATLYANAHRDSKTRAQPFAIDDFTPSRHGRAIAAKPDHCAECGLHAYYGHTEECRLGRELFDNMRAQMQQFSTAFPTVTNGG